MKAEITANNTVNVTWNAVATATKYNLLLNGNVIYKGEETKYEISGLLTGETYTIAVRVFNGVSKPATSDPISVTMRLVEPLLIYRTRNNEVYGFNSSESITPIIAEDLEYGSKTKLEICNNNTLISDSDLYTNGKKLSIEERETIVMNFFISQISYDALFSAILQDMMDHFVGKRKNNFTDTLEGDSGTYSVYENADLTDAVKSHKYTLKYVNGFIDRLNKLLKNNSGHIEELEYSEDLWTQIKSRRNHIVVDSMFREKEKEDDDDVLDLPQPSYGRDNGVPGLSLAVDGLYGNKIEIVGYRKNGTSYSGTLRFSLYDHFGLDTSDLADEKKYSNDNLGKIFGVKPGLFPGFRQWYIMQHWNEARDSIQPKPFITMMKFEFPFSGNI